MAKMMSKIARNIFRPWRWSGIAKRLLLPKRMDPLVRKAKAHLAEILKQQPRDKLPDLGERWTWYSDRLLEHVNGLQTRQDIIAYGQSGDSGIECPHSGRELKGMIYHYELATWQEFPQYAGYLSQFQASDLSHPSYVRHVKDWKIDHTTMCCAHHVFRCLSALGDHPLESICEIGGGTGAPARAWLTNPIMRPKRYCIIDLPETLIFSEVQLRHEFGDANVHYVLSDEPLNPGVAPRIVLCPVNHIAALQPLSFDLVVNTGSMQEMADDWIDYYMAWLDRHSCTFFYSSNYFGSPLDLMLEGANSWSPRPSATWQLRFARLCDGPRPLAQQVFQRGDSKVFAIGEQNFPSLAGWLNLLEGVRLERTQSNLLKAIDYACNVFPYIPKEAWLLAKWLKDMGNSSGIETFMKLDKLRSGGIEALH